MINFLNMQVNSKIFFLGLSLRGFVIIFVAENNHLL